MDTPMYVILSVITIPVDNAFIHKKIRLIQYFYLNQPDFWVCAVMEAKIILTPLFPLSQ